MNPLSERIAKLSPEQRRLVLEKLREQKLTQAEDPQHQALRIMPVDRSQAIPLSFSQQRLWFLNLLEGSKPTYNLVDARRLAGALDVGALRQALDALSRRHEILRTRFPMQNGEPVQAIAAKLDLPLSQIDLQALEAEDQTREVQRLIAHEAHHAFDLAEGPLLRVHLLKLAEREHVLLLNMHHIITDAWSLGILIRELSALYPICTGGGTSPLPALPIQYADFAHWQRRWLAGEAAKTQLDYWRRQLATAPPLLELPTDWPRPALQSYRGRSYRFQLDADLSQQLKTFSQENGATLFMTLFAAFVCLLYRYSGQCDICVGTPIANRNHPETEDLIGFFINTLVLRVRLGARLAFLELLKQVRQTALDAYTHQDLPFEKLVEALRPDRSLSYSPLFQVMFVLQNAPMGEPELPGLQLTPVATETVAAKFDLTLSMEETPWGLTGEVEYNTGLFDHTTIERLVGHFRNLLYGIGAAPRQSIAELPLLTEGEYRQFRDWNDTVAAYPQGQCIHQLFEAQAERTPTATAVVFVDQRLSYAELNRRANQLAHTLQAAGVKPEVVVGLYTERSPAAIIGLLGILKAGGAYLPLDPNLPPARLSGLLEETQVPVLVTQTGLVEHLPEPFRERAVCLDSAWETITPYPTDNPVSRVGPANLAYVIYTSGSTGRPKGVLVEHRGLTNLACAQSRAFRVQSDSRVLQFAALSFDASLAEIAMSLCSGAQLCLAGAEELLPGPALLQLLRGQGITHVTLPPSALAVFPKETPLDLPHLIVAGEACSPELAARWSKGRFFFNAYGPTEATVCATLAECSDSQGKPPIGRPIANTRVHLLDANQRPVPIGVAGELYLGGVGVARGYLERPGLTAERFVPDPFSQAPGARLYRTGDLGRYRPDGAIEYLGRTDHQVKLRGFRIELGEIEATLAQHPHVRHSAVVVQESAARERRLVAYVVPAPAHGIDPGELRRFLQERLPEYMIPSGFVPLAVLPLNPNGKLDCRALPPPEGARSPEVAYAMPRTAAEQRIAQVWRQVLQLENVGVDDNFFDLGGHSLLMVRVHNELQALFGQALAMVELFQYPTIRTLAKHLTQDHQQAPEALENPAVAGSRDIAIIGMACRFPGAGDVDAFWRNLRDEVESIRFFSDAELLAAGVDSESLNNPRYVKARAVLDAIDLFDAAFFEYSPREAELLDPQQRLFLECAWEAIETAGYDVDRLKGGAGVYAGVGMNTYVFNNLYPRHELLETVGSYQLMLNNDKDYLATRVSYKLNLTGPSVGIQTACSTSLVAVHLAVRSLLAGECDLALAGGVSVSARQVEGYLYQEGMILSPDGHCRAFDAQAAGTVSGSGVGCVVLKRLEQALADGDRIQAVIKGSAINNDGALKVGYTAPSVAGQAAVIAAAMQGLEYDSIGYVEAHGTATPLGDPIEVKALTQAYRRQTEKTGYCALGSVKTNFGHLDTAAGVAGLIKVVLALQHRQLPPSLHYQAPNPQIAFADSPFFVNTALTAWPAAGHPRRAAVSSFGIGGTNAHVVVEEAPPLAPTSASRPWQLLVLSARSAAALEAATVRLAAHLERYPELELADVAYTLSLGRKLFAQRRVVLAPSATAAGEALRAVDSRVLTQHSTARQRPVVFLFSGQGSQHVNMGLGLYQHEALFREQVDRCAERLQPHLNLDLCQVLYPPASQASEAAERLTQTGLTQPALFVLEYALAQLWLSWGVQPAAMLGHSLGEYVAACLAGVFSLEDALALVAARGRLMQALPSGAMLSVPLPEAELLPLLSPALALAAHNGPAACVVSGPTAAVTDLEYTLRAQGIDGVRLKTSHAFHSAMLEPILAAFTEQVSRLSLHPPQRPYLSNVSGTWITAAEATDPQYWVRHLRQTVRFAEGVKTLLQLPDGVLLEVGPGRTLAGLARQQFDNKSESPVLTSLPTASERQDEHAFLLTTLGRLWLAGVAVEWDGFYGRERRRRLPLPPYPFERQRFWVEPHPAGERAGALSRTRSNPADWFYVPVWQRTIAPVYEPGEALPSTGWLVLVDDCGLGAQLAQHLEQAGQAVMTVAKGSTFARLSPSAYTLDPGRAEDYQALFAELRRRGPLPKTIVHFWSVTPDCFHESHGFHDLYRSTQATGFYSLLFIARALWDLNATDELQIEVVTNQVQAVTGTECLIPEKATVLGPAKVIPQEYPTIRCRSIDIVLPPAGAERNLVGQLLAEFAGECGNPPVSLALRGHYRWEQTFAAHRLERSGDGTVGLRKRGVYLITGGLGGIGLILAEHLATTVQARLVLISRSGLPPREEWASWSVQDPLLAQEAAADEKIQDRIRKVLALEALGSEVMVLKADVAEREQMQSACEQATARFGAIHGVIHAAAIAGGGAIQVHAVETAEQEFTPKIKGTRVLEALFRHGKLDFMLLCSSLNALTGGEGQVGYCAANAFLDAFAHAQAGQADTYTVSVDWERWQGIGMARTVEARHQARTGEALAGGLTARQGADAFSRILGKPGLPQVVVFREDLVALIQEVGKSTPSGSVEAPAPVSTAHARPRLANAYVAPRSGMERRVAAIWQEVLGIAPVGVDDNFFELGGDSLIAVRVVALVRESLDVDLNVRLLFEQPTVAGLAGQIEALLVIAPAGLNAPGEPTDDYVEEQL